LDPVGSGSYLAIEKNMDPDPGGQLIPDPPDPDPEHWLVQVNAYKKQVQKQVYTVIETGLQHLTNEMYNFVQKYCRSLYVCISRLSFDHFTIV
jgi:hypothetical protein